MFQSEIVRWVSKDRWYHAYIVCDLLGDWTVVRQWGGLHNRRGGQKIDHVSCFVEANAHMKMIERRRRYSHSGYQQVIKPELVL